MAKEISKEDVITTQEGTDLIVKPLTIRSLRKFMTVIDKLNVYQREIEENQREYQKALREYNDAVANGDEDAEEPDAPEEDDFAVIDIMMEAAKIALEKHNPDFVKSEDRLEDELDMPVLNQILEVSGGIKLGDPNQLGAPTATKA